ncbi:hypothetical protein [Streptomyces vinaceus]|uniref:hypothetical protein n=1 Tax=Streptomyces vinaceus TaxID=1960 RepID=UPI00367D9392
MFTAARTDAALTLFPAGSDPDELGAAHLLAGDQDITRLAAQTRTFAEHLVNDAPGGWRPPMLSRAATVQTHCHQHAVLDTDPDRELMRRAGLEANVLDGGCCGLAGNFGFEQGHYDLSRTIAEQGVLPAVCGTEPGAFVLADGFSCRARIGQADTGRQAVHLAEALALALDGPPPADRPERAVPRPGHRPASGLLLTAGLARLAAGTAGAGALAARHRHRIRKGST